MEYKDKVEEFKKQVIRIRTLTEEIGEPFRYDDWSKKVKVEVERHGVSLESLLVNETMANHHLTPHNTKDKNKDEVIDILKGVIEVLESSDSAYMKLWQTSNQRFMTLLPLRSEEDILKDIDLELLGNRCIYSKNFTFGFKIFCEMSSVNDAHIKLWKQGVLTYKQIKELKC